MGQELFQHGNLEGKYIHKITRWRFVDTAARMDPSNLFTFRDIDKVCYDAETEKYYVLHKILPGFIPEWQLISAVDVIGEANTLYTIGTGVALNGAKVGTTLGIRSIAGTANQVTLTELPDGTVRIGVASNLSIPFANITGVPAYLPTSYVPPLATSLTDGTITSAMFDKINGIAAGATVNSSDASLRDRATHTGTQPSSSISDLSEAVQDIVGSFIVAGSNVTVTYNDALNTLQISSTASGGASVFTDLTDVPSTYAGQSLLFVRVKADESGLEFAGGGGGGAATNLGYTASPTNGLVTSDTGTDATLTLVDGTNAGLMAPAQHTKLASVQASATANAADSYLLARANHTGTQTASTIIDFNSAADARVAAGITGKQDTLVSGSNIKTINGVSVLGSGDITVSGGATDLGNTTTGSTVTLTSSTGASTVLVAAGTAGKAGIMTNSQATALVNATNDITTLQSSKQNTLPTVTATRITYGDGTNLPAHEADFTYDPATNLMTVPAIVLSGQTANTLLALNGTKQLESLPTASYPNFTELQYLKGVTSAIQTQFAAKQDTLTSGTNIKTVNGSSLLGSGNLSVSADVKTKTFWDFITNNGIITPWTGNAISGGSNGSVAGAADMVGHPGVTILTASTTANSGYRYNTFTTMINLIGGETARFVFYIVTGLSATTRLTMGYLTSGTHTNGSDEAVITVDGLVATGRCTSNSTSTSSATIATLSSNTWYKGKVAVAPDGLSVTFSIYTDAGTLVGSETVTANLPTTGTRKLGHGLVCTSSGTTAGSMALIDYLDMEETGLNRNF